MLGLPVRLNTTLSPRTEEDQKGSVPPQLIRMGGVVARATEDPRRPRETKIRCTTVIDSPQRISRTYVAKTNRLESKGMRDLKRLTHGKSSLNQCSYSVLRRSGETPQDLRISFSSSGLIAFLNLAPGWPFTLLSQSAQVEWRMGAPPIRLK